METNYTAAYPPKKETNRHFNELDIANILVIEVRI